jgi:hypothetical protein
MCIGLTTSFILGYHGCDADVATRLIEGEPFKASENDYDWLGPGIYFWESNPQRARVALMNSCASSTAR